MNQPIAISEQEENLLRISVAKKIQHIREILDVSAAERNYLENLNSKLLEAERLLCDVKSEMPEF